MKYTVSSTLQDTEMYGGIKMRKGKTRLMTIDDKIARFQSDIDLFPIFNRFKSIIDRKNELPRTRFEISSAFHFPSSESDLVKYNTDNGYLNHLCGR